MIFLLGTEARGQVHSLTMILQDGKVEWEGPLLEQHTKSQHFVMVQDWKLSTIYRMWSSALLPEIPELMADFDKGSFAVHQLIFHYTPFSHDWLRYWKGLDWLWVHIFKHSLFLCSTVKVYWTEGSYFEFKDSIYGLSCLCSFILVVFAVKMINKLKKLKCKSRAYCVHTKLIVPGLNCLIWNMNSKLEIYRQMQPECSTIYHCVGLHCHRKSYNGVLDLYKSLNPWWNNLPTHTPSKVGQIHCRLFTRSKIQLLSEDQVKNGEGLWCIFDRHYQP